MANHNNLSVIIPIHNGSKWINYCFESIVTQTALNNLKCEICVCNDSSTDNTSKLLDTWSQTFEKMGVPLKVYNNNSSVSGGVGYSKNKAFSISCGSYLCFQDIDDTMLPERIYKQYQQARIEPENTILGCKFKRFPEGSTRRYVRWANNLKSDQLNTQIYTANGPTVIMPTWFCHRSVFLKVGGFSENGKGTPEDLIFFYNHLDLGGKISRIDEELLIYNYHMRCESFVIKESTIWDLRIKMLEKNILHQWAAFTIWNAGKQGKQFYKSLSPCNQNKVVAFCDVDKKKIGKVYTPYDAISHKAFDPIKIIHFKIASPPFIICVKLDLTSGEFEENLNSLKLKENIDYIYFS